MSLLETVLIVGVAIIAVPPLLERLGVDLRAGEVITGALLVGVAPSLASAEWLAGVAEFGLLVLMFEIGLDIDLDRVRGTFRNSLAYAVLAFIVPFVVVFVLVTFATRPMVGMVVAIGLSSTALAVVSPLMRDRGIDSALVKNAVMFTEMMGILLLVALVRGTGTSPGALAVQAVAIVAFVAATVLLVPRITERLHLLEANDFIRFEMKLVLFIVLVLALASERLGIHAATGAFLAGLFFAESTHRGLELEERIQPVTEILVPIFFFHIGTLMAFDTITAVHVGAATGLAAAVHLSRMLAFRLVAPRIGLAYRFRDVNLFAPCITITATAASIGRGLSVLSPATFTTFLLAGLILTVLGPLISAHR